MATLTREADVFVLDLGDDENRIRIDWMRQIDDALVEIAATDGPRALVTVATGKFWSNGLDLDWMQANPDGIAGYIASFQEILAKLLELPVPTIATLQGHCYAGGALIALAHDVRHMRADRGFFCLPEVAIHIPFAPGMSSLIQDKFDAQTAIDTMVHGTRYGGEAACAAGIVQRATSEDKLRSGAMALAAELAPNAGPVLGKIRSQMFATTIRLLRDNAGLELP